MKIIQYADVLDYGDGIANDIWGKHAIFQSLGYESVVCALVIDPRLKNKAKPFQNLKIGKNDIFLHHYSGFSRAIDKIQALKCTKVMIYHNITPPEFVQGETREHCLRGIEQLKSLGGEYHYFVGDSQFNVDCLKELGVTAQGDVLPIAVEFTDKKLQHKQKTADTEKVFLFVGRIAQNKKIDNVIKVFDYYYNHVDSNCKLCIPGNLEVSPDYTRKLVELVESLPSGNCIDLMGKISDQELRGIFGDADVYLSMSEHEGFGIPLLEAMNYEIPVVAFDSAAVAETMGHAGVLLKSNEPVAAALVVHQVLSHPELQKSILEEQKKNLDRFKRAAVAERIELLLKKWQGDKVEMPNLFVKDSKASQNGIFCINQDKELTEKYATTVAEELQKAENEQSLFASVARRRAGRRRRSKLSNYAYYLQIMEENKFPVEKVPENTRFKVVKQAILRLMNLVFQYQQQFNRATEDVVILMTRDLKSLDMRQQAMEDKLEIQVVDLLERQAEEIRSLETLIGELKEKQAMLEAKIARYKAKKAEQGKDAK